MTPVVTLEEVFLRTWAGFESFSPAVPEPLKVFTNRKIYSVSYSRWLLTGLGFKAWVTPTKNQNFYGLLEFTFIEKGIGSHHQAESLEWMFTKREKYVFIHLPNNNDDSEAEIHL